MTDAKFSDIDKKVYPTDECYTMQIKNLESKAFLEIDLHRDQKDQTIKDAMQLALQNGSKWKQWKQVDQPDGTKKLQKVEVGGIDQQQIA